MKQSGWHTWSKTDIKAAWFTEKWKGRANGRIGTIGRFMENMLLCKLQDTIVRGFLIVGSQA